MEQFLRILDPLVLKLVTDKIWKLAKVFRFQIYGLTYAVPRGFQTDLDSMWRIPFLYELFGACATKASVIHDFLYRTGLVPRRTADKVFYWAMKATGVPTWKALAMWLGVRLCGRPYYKGRKGGIV